MTGRIAINFSIHVPFRMMCKSDHLMVNLSLTSHHLVYDHLALNGILFLPAIAVFKWWMLISIIDIIDQSFSRLCTLEPQHCRVDHSHVRIFGDKSDYWTESEVLS